MSPAKITYRQEGTAGRAGEAAAKRRHASRPKKPEAARRSGNGKRMVSAEERHRMIQFAAYQRAERRGFEGGSPEQDWFEAEVEIDQTLATTSH